MKLISRLKENYQNGKKEKTLLEKRGTYYSAIDNGFQGDMFYEGVIKVNQKLREIPKPRGFLEKLVYSIGGI